MDQKPGHSGFKLMLSLSNPSTKTDFLESLDTLPMSANKKKLEVGKFSTFRFKQKTILRIQLCSVSLETSTLGSVAVELRIWQASELPSPLSYPFYPPRSSQLPKTSISCDFIKCAPIRIPVSNYQKDFT